MNMSREESEMHRADTDSVFSKGSTLIKIESPKKGGTFIYSNTQQTIIEKIEEE